MRTEVLLLSAEVALVLISDKARFQAARTPDNEASTSLLEIVGHCEAGLRIIKEAREGLFTIETIKETK